MAETAALAKPGAIAKTAVGVGGGVGVGLLIAQLLEGQPQIVAQLVGQLAAWGPGLLILAAFAWIAHQHAPAIIQAQVRQAEAMSDLSASIRERFNAEDDVRMAVRTQSAQFERLNAKLDTVLAALDRDPARGERTQAQ